MSSVSVVGFGRVGSALARSLRNVGWSFQCAVVRSNSATSLGEIERLGGTAISGRQPIASDVIFVTVGDAAISQVVEERLDQFQAGATVVHCAGSLGLEVFGEARTRRNDLSFGVFHPLQTVPIGAPIDVFVGAYAGIESDSEQTNSQLVELAAALEMNAVEVTAETRARYHAAATIASNHVTALLSQVETLSSDIGIPFRAFQPLVRAAVQNTFDRGAHLALTGPVSRGDVETVQRHLAALDEQSRSAYSALALAALALVPNPSEEIRTILGA